MERKAGPAKEEEDGEEGRGNARAASRENFGTSREEQQQQEKLKGKGAEDAGEKPSGKTPGGGVNDGSSHQTYQRVPPAAAAAVKVSVVTGSTITRNPSVTLTGLDRMMAAMMNEPCMADLVGGGGVGGGVASTRSSQSSVVQPQQR